MLISDDTIYGLGIHFLHSLFGSIFLIARTPPLSASAFVEPLDSLDMVVPAADVQTLPPRYDIGDLSASAAAEQSPSIQNVASVLIGCFPDIEYFVAGGIAGIGKYSDIALCDSQAHRALTCSLSYLDSTSRPSQGLPYCADQCHQKNRCGCEVWQYFSSCHKCLASSCRCYKRALAGRWYAQSVCWSVEEIPPEVVVLKRTR